MENWRPIDIKERLVQCQGYGCQRKAAWSCAWKTTIMPALAFAYLCNKHKAIWRSKGEVK